MPRKATPAKKETSGEPKSEGGSTRRSGRAAAKPEPAKETSREATRSRRSSTAAQTAASVADSKAPKRSTSSRRDSTSPSDNRQKSRRESGESAATRAKSTRRASGRVNYKESDGEDEGAAPRRSHGRVNYKESDEETATPKYDENFESNEDVEDSESDEKSTPKGRTRGAKPPAKGRRSHGKAKGGRGRRGRPKKQSSDEEEDEPIELSEESVEIESETMGKKGEEKETTRSGRNRKSRVSAESKAATEEKPKSSRRSARSSTAKDEPPKKRPSRSVQAKRYTEEEEDDDDIEEIHDSKSEDEGKPLSESGRKRKRGSATESNKKLKEGEEESTESKEKEDETSEKAEEKSAETKPVSDSESAKEKKDEPMEVDSSDAEASNKSAPPAKEEKVEEKTEAVKEEKKESEKEGVKEDTALTASKEKLAFANKQGSVDSSENLDESVHSFDSDQGSRAEQSISSGLEDSQDMKETKQTDNVASHQESSASEKVKSQANYQQESSDSFQELDDSSESKSLNESAINSERKQEPAVDKKETNVDLKTDNSAGSLQNDTNIPQETKSVDKTPVPPPVSSVLAVTSHSKESNMEVSFNGSEKIPNSTQVIHSTSAVNLHPEDSAPKANGDHDLHNNSVPESDQYYPFPGRKYVINAKLGDSLRQSVKDKSFGFVSYNLGISSSDSSIQKEKLLNELNKLDTHIICIQQVSKSFYCSILEPSLDALGFKGTFSQPEESEKGVATFYKSSLFRLSGQSKASLKQLIEKELEASSLDANDRTAVKSYVKKCGHVLFTHFATVFGMHSLTVANVQVPPTDLSIHALQVSCLVREVVKINGGTSRPFLLGGEFNMMESEAPYQLLRDGYLSNDMIEELQRRKDVVLPGKENAALVNLLWKSFQHPSSTLCSCYKSVLDHEVFIPEQKITSRDLLWYSSDSLYTVGVLDTSETLSDQHFSLKADVAFSV